MSPRLESHESADLELNAAADSCGLRSPGLGGNLSAEVERGLGHVAEHPEAAEAAEAATLILLTCVTLRVTLGRWSGHLRTSRRSSSGWPARWADCRPISSDGLFESFRQIDATDQLDSLRVPPGNHLHALEGDRAGQHSISVNDQWRICFRFQEGDAYDVEVCDCH